PIKSVHYTPDWIVHYIPDWIVHYTPEYSISSKNSIFNFADTMIFNIFAPHCTLNPFHLSHTYACKQHGIFHSAL
ncbi:MAG: hypothetical protein JXA77_13230, partial [Bacteroidales bacterium]|nr:hypothetical protein [Bacteroidales bacterium]